MKILAVTLLGSTALLSASAMAQTGTSPNQPNVALVDCDRLIVVLEQRQVANAPVTLEQARVYRRDANVQACRDALTRISQATGQQDQRTAQQAPQVQVQQGAPNVTVRQPQPEIIVRQAPPTITVQQPQPEIIVRMPEPDVNVSLARPDVQVQMPQPQVQVIPPQDQSNVQVSQQQQQPNVRFERSGQPRVVYQQAPGEPRIRYESAANAQQESQQQQAQQQQAQQQSQQAAQTGAIGGGQRVLVSRIKDMNLFNARGQQLGDVERVVVGNDGRAYIVIGHGGFLGLGEKQVALPLENVALQGDRLVIRGVTEQQIEAMPAFNIGDGNFRELNDNQTTQVSANL